MDLQITGKRAVITGASTGIGAGIAKTLAAEGARLVLVARRTELLNGVADEIAEAGAERPAIVTADLTDRADIERITQEIEDLFGGTDILINGAGASSPTTADASNEFWDEAFALNFEAPRILTHALIPGMRKQRWGRVVTITGSTEPRLLNAAIAAKGAVHLWAKGLSCEVAPDAVTVNCVVPGRINSEQILTRLYPDEESRKKFIDANVPMGYFGEPEDVANLVAFLASPLAGYITGNVIPVDGGMHYFAH